MFWSLPKFKCYSLCCLFFFCNKFLFLYAVFMNFSKFLVWIHHNAYRSVLSEKWARLFKSALYIWRWFVSGVLVLACKFNMNFRQVTSLISRILFLASQGQAFVDSRVIQLSLRRKKNNNPWNLYSACKVKNLEFTRQILVWFCSSMA